MSENKVKTFIRNNFIYFIIAFACIAYVVYGMVHLEASGKTIIQIIGESFVIFLFGWSISFLFSLQGMNSGDNEKDVIDTNKLHAKCVEDIDPKINEMDDWCELENDKALKKIRKRLLNQEGMKYDDYFDADGIAKNDVEFKLEAMPIPADYENIEKYKLEKKKVKYNNKRVKAKRKMFRKATRVKITLLSTDLITATTIKNNDPNNLGIDRKQYQKMDARSDLASRVIMGVVFAYFSVSFLFGWAYLISALVQVATFLLLGGIKFMQSRYFVKEDLRKRTVRQINFMQKFKCDKGLASIKEVKEELKTIKDGQDNTILETKNTEEI